jgi:phosphate transport system substrate-binding protein
MKHSKWWLGFVGAVLAGCNSKPASSSAAGASDGDANHLIGAGSTFVYPVMMRWVDDFRKSNGAVTINYQSIGSGGGIQQLKKGLVDFGASDAALSDETLKTFSSPVLQIPESAGPVCISYNLPDLKQPLRLTAKAVAGIYLGTITSWQDPEITKSNPGAALPKSPIIVAHRSDGSGTTNIFTTYLTSVSPEWQKKVGLGTSVNWPVGLGGKGNEGVTGIVKQSPGSIGYVELAYATENKLPVAEVQNAAGKFIAPSAESTSLAIAAYADKIAQDVRIPIVNPPASAEGAYPISGFTYLMVYKDGPNAAKRQMVKHFIRYIVSEGQQAAETLHYAPLPPAVATQDQKLIDQMTADGKPLS